MNIKERYFENANALSRTGIGMKNFPTLKELWENADEQKKNKNKNVKGREGGNVTLISELRSHNYERRKSIV